MVQNVILISLASGLTCILGFLAYHTSLHPPQTARERTRKKLIFSALSIGMITSIVQAYWNDTNQKSIEAKIKAETEAQINAYSKAVNSGYTEMQQVFVNKCSNGNDFEKVRERCLTGVQAALAKLGRPQSQTVAAMKGATGTPTDFEQPAAAPQTQTEQSQVRQPADHAAIKVAPLKESHLPENQGMVIRYSDGPRCFDILARPVYQGCATASCEDACITMPLEDLPKTSAPGQKSK